MVIELIDLLHMIDFVLIIPFVSAILPLKTLKSRLNRQIPIRLLGFCSRTISSTVVVKKTIL